ncbi:MAG: DUF2341 domain-containing protein [Candidatus Omnitrophota bacterium]
MAGFFPMKKSAIAHKGSIVILLACVVFLFSFFQNAVASEVTVYSSPYTWRQDGTGDFELPVIAERMEYISSPVGLKDSVSSLTATWQATGPVALYVSADGGNHYTRVVNGTPVSKGLEKGSTLKWKAVLGEGTSLTEVSLAVTTIAGSNGSFGSPALSGFAYRKAFIVAGGALGLYNYQVSLQLGESAFSKTPLHAGNRILNDFKDVRFTLADGLTLIPHSLVKIEGQRPNRVATFFVRVPEIPKEGVALYVYYANASAESLSSPKETFDLYADFTTEPAIDQTQWTVSPGVGGSAQVSKDGLLLDASTVTAKAFEFKDGIIELVADAQTGYELRLIARDPDPASASDVTLTAYTSGLKDVEHALVVDNIVKANTPKPISAGVYYGFRLSADTDNLLTFERFNETFSEKQASVSYTDKEGPKKGYLALKTTGPGLGRSLTKVRWIRSRKYADPEPFVAAASINTEEKLDLPVFADTMISPKGELILTQGASQGSYTTPLLKPGFDIRVLTLSWKAAGASLEISTDEGRTYKKNFSKDTFYYSSRGDFAKSQTLKARLTLKKEASVRPYAESLSLQCNPGAIVLLSPSGGFISPGSQTSITWTAWDYETSYLMKLEYSADAGKTYQLISPKVLNTGSFVWQAPAVQTSKALVRISDSLDSQAYDVSDKVFSIGTDANFNALGEDQAAEDQKELTEEEQEELKDLEEESLKDQPQIPAARQLYELLIKIGDTKIANADTDKRAAYKEGDIVMIRPAGHPWGAQEREQFVIIKAYLTEREADELMSPKRSADGQMTGRRKYKVDVKKQRLVRGRGRLVQTRPLIQLTAVEAK